ncbi:MAG TPA: hypothetical protein VM597_08765, partial [Gemmataceae bacterium]|nr:hypothetical protein [Gemmataceae bacterium]
MTPFPPARRPLFAVAGFFALTAAVLAQDPKQDAPDAKVTLSLTADGTAGTTADVRPNNRLKVYVVLSHTADLDRTYRVQLIGPKEKALAAPKTVVVPAGKPVAIAFDPPAPKKDAPKADAPAPKKDDDAAPKAEPPPGFLLPVTEDKDNVRAFKFTVRVTSDPPKADMKPNDTPFTVIVSNPTTYIDEPQVTVSGARGIGITANVRAKSNAPKAENDFVPKVPVNLVFPPQLGVRTTELRAGTYTRDLFKTGQEVRLSAENLPLTRVTDRAKFHLDVDGYARAFTYTLDLNRVLKGENADNRVPLDPADTPAVRLYPTGASRRDRDLAQRVTTGTLATPKYPTLPAKDLRFKVEVDRAPPRASLEIRIDRTGNRQFQAPDERIALGEPRDTKVYLEPGGVGGAWT